MRVIDPGHTYALKHLDGAGEEIINFVKREGEKYPGNVGSHPGTNLQDSFRACIDRLFYLHQQDPHWSNEVVISLLRDGLKLLETRAAERHGRKVKGFWSNVEKMETCVVCGHIGCKEAHPVSEKTGEGRQNQIEVEREESALLRRKAEALD